MYRFYYILHTYPIRERPWGAWKSEIFHNKNSSVIVSEQKHTFARHDKNIQLEYNCSVNGDADLLFAIGKGESIVVVNNTSIDELKEVLIDLISESDHLDHSQATATATTTTESNLTRRSSDSSGTYRNRHRKLTRCHQRNNRSLAAKLKLATCHSISIVIELATTRRGMYPFNQLILSPGEEQDELEKSLAGLSSPSLCTANATIGIPPRTPRTRPQMFSDTLTTSHTQIQPELTEPDLFEVY